MRTIKHLLGICFLTICSACSSSSEKYEPIYTASVDLSLQTTAGEEVQLSDYLKPDKYTLVEFWRGKCSYCIKAYKPVVELAAQYADELNVVGVIVNDFDSSLDFIRANKPTWAQLMDPYQQSVQAYKLKGVPTFVLINKKGEQFLKTSDIKKVARYLEQDLALED